MNDIIEFPSEGTIPAENFKPDKPRLAEIPTPSMLYKKNLEDARFKKLDTAAGLYVIPIQNNHFHFFVVMNADTSHDVKTSDFVRLEWQANDGSINYRTERTEVRCIEQPIRFLLPKDQIKKFESIFSTIRLVRERLNEPDLPSAPIPLLVASAFKASGNIIVEGVKDGILDPAEYPNGIKVTSQEITNVSQSTRIIAQFRHPTTPLQFNQEADQSSGIYVFNIPPKHYQGDSGTPITVQLALLLSSHDFDFWYGLGAVNFKLK
ncbi:hypothetical protein ACQR3P_11965 [Rhodococcus sp. IEGM1300]